MGIPYSLPAHTQSHLSVLCHLAECLGAEDKSKATGRGHLQMHPLLTPSPRVSESSKSRFSSHPGPPCMGKSTSPALPGEMQMACEMRGQEYHSWQGRATWHKILGLKELFSRAQDLTVGNCLGVI